MLYVLTSPCTHSTQESIEDFVTFYKSQKVDRKVVEVKKKEWGRIKVVRKCKELQYHLLKHMFFEEHFKQGPLGTSAKERGKADFSFYIETAVVLRIIESFEIEFMDWVFLFVCTVPVTVDWGVAYNYHVFFIACISLLGVSVTITVYLSKYISTLLMTKLGITNPNSLLQLVEKAQSFHLKVLIDCFHSITASPTLSLLVAFRY
jgi:hypothetical protein